MLRPELVLPLPGVLDVLQRGLQLRFRILQFGGLPLQLDLRRLGFLLQALQAILRFPQGTGLRIELPTGCAFLLRRLRAKLLGLALCLRVVLFSGRYRSTCGHDSANCRLERGAAGARQRRRRQLVHELPEVGGQALADRGVPVVGAVTGGGRVVVEPCLPFAHDLLEALVRRARILLPHEDLLPRQRFLELLPILPANGLLADGLLVPCLLQRVSLLPEKSA
mmetsp:Transcript_1240/g.3729  ORF Transcript_1240/g.3729 Transcript_1240/m.3729 type:complete len:223 (-) Transcript_1240:1746-2414(-)